MNIDVCDLLFVVVTVNYGEVETIAQFSKSYMSCHHNCEFVHLLLFSYVSVNVKNWVERNDSSFTSKDYYLVLVT